MSEVVAQLVRASAPGLCRAEQPGFEPVTYSVTFISSLPCTL